MKAGLRRRAAGPSLAGAKKQLALVAEALAWTSAERDRRTAELEAAAQRDAAAWAAFAERLAGWSRTALEKDPRPVESPRLSVLSALSEIVRETKETPDLLSEALELLHGAVSYESATFFLYDRAKDGLVPAASSGAHVDLIPEIQFELGQGLSSWVARTRRPVLLSELRREGRDADEANRPGSFLSVPLVVQRELVGVLNLGHTQPGAFTEADRDLLSAAGAVLAAPLMRQIAYEEARRRSTTDELTGLPNRAQFENRVSEELEKARRYGYPFAVVLVDPDRFSAVNQAFGPAHGDACLLALAEVLSVNVRKSDLIARLGPGDEFALLLPHQDAEAARQAVDRLARAIEAHAFPKRRRVGVSLGWAVYPHDAVEREALLARAAVSLDEAKARVRGGSPAPAPALRPLH
jgi:diguanylate cyclase (GGDEF)-like protein